MKIRITPLYLGTMFIMIIILTSSFVTIGTWMQWWGEWDVYQVVWTFIVNWVIVITFAILGGILFGMFVGFRLLSSQGFTPFEKEMLMMMRKIDDIPQRLDEIEHRLDAMTRSSPTGTNETTSDSAGVLMSSDPAPGTPDDTAPGTAVDPAGPTGSSGQGRGEHPWDPRE